MAKLGTLFMIALFLVFMLTCTARPDPSPVKTKHRDAEGEKDEMEEANCEELTKEECLMRRTLAAHTDYIYTQKHHH